MSLTVSHLGSSVFGNFRVQFVRLTPSQTGNPEVWTTGFNNIVGVSVDGGSAVSGGFNVQPNVLSAATASPGSLCLKSHTAGDEMLVSVFGY